MRRTEIENSSHSSEKDHAVMTGGTLTVDKRVLAEEAIVLTHYILPGIAVPISGLFQGLHTLEHMLAHSRETGGLRAQIAEVTRDDDLAKLAIDISPYCIGENCFGFRVTSAGSLDLSELTEAYDRSLRLGKKYIDGGGEPPFATPEQCGQYDFHSSQSALEIVQAARKVLGDADFLVTETTYPGHICKTITVGDLRLIKPRARNNREQRVLEPESSYAISQLLERYTYRAITGGREGDFRFGTMGCMTGDYIMLADRQAEEAHIAVTRVLLALGLLRDSNDGKKRAIGSDATFCLEHIRNFSSRVYAEAMKLGFVELS